MVSICDASESVPSQGEYHRLANGGRWLGWRQREPPLLAPAPAPGDNVVTVLPGPATCAIGLAIERSESSGEETFEALRGGGSGGVLVGGAGRGLWWQRRR